MVKVGKKMDKHSLDESEYMTTCSICFLNFDLELCRPKVLPCSHTFCFKCLQAIHSVTLKCPVCCAVIELTDVTTLPNNLFAQHIICLNQQLAMSTSWCYPCKSQAKPGCQEQKHRLRDMNKDNKEILSEIERSNANLVEAINLRRQMSDTLETSLTHLKFNIEEIQKQISVNNLEIHLLQKMLDTEPDFKALLTRFQKSLNALNESKQVAAKWQVRLEVLSSNKRKLTEPVVDPLHGQTQSNFAQQGASGIANTKKRARNTVAEEREIDLIRWKQGGLSGSFFAVSCRYVRMGSYKCSPFGRVLISSKGIVLETPVFDPQEQSASILTNVALSFKDFSTIEACFDRKLTIIFISTSQKMAQDISMQLGLAGSPYCWDSQSSQEGERRLVLLPFGLDNAAKNEIREAFNPILREINIVEAKRLLDMSSTPDVRDSLNFSPATTRATSIASSSKEVPSKVERRVTRSFTKAAIGSKKTVFESVNRDTPLTKKTKKGS